MSVLGTILTVPAEWLTEAKVVSAGPSHDEPAPEVPSPTQRQEENRDLEQNTGEEGTSSRDKEFSGTCVTCGIGSILPAFGSLPEQREHFRTDWHRLNLKRRAAGQPPLTEEAFDQAVSNQQEVGSISGSDEESSDDEEASRRTRAAQRSPQVMFQTQEGTAFAVWRVLLTSEPPSERASTTEAKLLHQLTSLRAAPQRWAVVLSGGGHFAAAIFDLAVPSAKSARRQPTPQQGAAGAGAGPGLPTQRYVPDAELFAVAEHKTFHRYVVRQGQGGRQSVKDASGKYAKSAGSRLRRHNEAALERDIQETLHSWSHQLASCAVLFVQAGGANAKAVFGGEQPPLNRSDGRLRSIPFTTRRPTFGEVKRVVRVLLSVYEVGPEALSAARPPEPGSELSSEVANAAKVEQKKKAAKTEKEEKPSWLEPIEPALPPVEDSPLHKAVAAGDASAVEALLDGGADPTVKDSRGRTPYAAASEKDIRDVFRRHMAKAPEQWDYAAAGVPSPLTEEMEAQQAAKLAEKKAKQKEREKERKARAAEKKKTAAADGAAAAAAEVERAAAEAAALASRSNRSRDEASGKAAAKREAAAAAAAAGRREAAAAAAEARMAALRTAAQKQQLW